MCVRVCETESRQMQQLAADYTTECQLEPEVTLVLVHLNTNLLGSLSFVLVSASWFSSFPLLLFGCFSLFLHFLYSDATFIIYFNSGYRLQHLVCNGSKYFILSFKSMNSMTPFQQRYF